MKTQRYDLVAVTYYGYYTDHEMQKEEDGEWIRYDDHLAALDARDEQWERAIRGRLAGLNGTESVVADCRERVQREEQSNG